jgi:hypothetical protein
VVGNPEIHPNLGGNNRGLQPAIPRNPNPTKTSSLLNSYNNHTAFNQTSIIQHSIKLQSYSIQSNLFFPTIISHTTPLTSSLASTSLSNLSHITLSKINQKDSELLQQATKLRVSPFVKKNTQQIQMVSEMLYNFY